MALLGAIQMIKNRKHKAVIGAFYNNKIGCLTTDNGCRYGFNDLELIDDRIGLEV